MQNMVLLAFSIWLQITWEQDQYMNAEQIKEMAAAGWEVGSHSISHLDLTTLDPERQRHEIVDSREILEAKLAYPSYLFPSPWHRATRQKNY